MAHELEELPLFPLHTVLFPYAQIQLNVFEDRYVQMVRHCREFDLPFGVSLIRAGSEEDPGVEPHMVGTVARMSVINEREDGGFEVHAYGERRFRIRRIDYDQPYMRGRVEAVVENELEDDDPRTYALTMRVQECFRELVQSTLQRQDFSVKINFPSDPTMVSFVIASLLPLDNIEKQRLLELTDTPRRLNELRELTERHLGSVFPTNVERLTLEHVEDIINPN